MDQKRIHAYWLLLIVMLCVLVLWFPIGKTHAHYVNTRVWNTVLGPQEADVISNCLVGTEEPAVTVLLGTMPLQKTEYTFTLESKTEQTGTFSCHVTQSNLLNVQLFIKDIPSNDDGTITLPAGETVNVTMSVTPTEDACTLVRGAVTVEMSVSWNSSLSATFWVGLPAVIATETEATEATETETTEVEETVPETTAPEETVSETTVPEETVPETTAPEETVSETTAPEETVPEITAPEVTEPEKISDETISVFSTTQTETEETEEIPTENIFTMIDHFDPAKPFPLKVACTEEMTSITLGIQDSDSAMQKFPAFTRFSLDGGNSYFLLYHESMIEIPANEADFVLLDLSHIPMDWIQQPELTLQAQTFTGSTLTGTYTAKTHADVILPGQNNVQIVKTVSETEQTRESGTPILTTENALEFSFLKEWESLGQSYTIDQLVEHPESGIGYYQIVPEDIGLITEERSDESSCVLSLKIGEILPPAGAYRVNIKWKFEESTFAQSQIYFFINYSSYLEDYVNPEETTPTEATPTEATPTEVTPTEVTPTEVTPTETEQSGGSENE